MAVNAIPVSQRKWLILLAQRALVPGWTGELHADLS
jgi:hypothetical protein